MTNKTTSPLTILLALATLLLAAGISHAGGQCPLPATVLDQHAALQALQRHDLLAMDASLLPDLKRLLSANVTRREVSDAGPPETLLTLDRQACLATARLAAAFSTGIAVRRDRINAVPGDPLRQALDR